jgi:tRNA(Ile)-lysidine synthase
MTPFIRNIRKTIQRFAMLQPGDRVVIGVSGGADSMTLLHILWGLRAEYHLSLVVAHLDHGLRPEAAEDKSFVKKAASDLGVPFFSRKVDVGARCREEHLNLQEAAREARYQFLAEIARDQEASRIALGHTADDQAESIIMRFLRGSGSRGLSGIPPVREGVIIRPLIETWRSEIESFLREKKFPYRIDASNQSTHFLRNRVRHELLPLLQEYNPRVRQTLVQMAEIFRAEESFWQGMVEEKFPSLIKSKKKKSLTLDIPLLVAQPYPLRLRIFRFALETLLGNVRRLSFVHILNIENLLQNKEPNKGISLPQDISVDKAYQALIFSKAKEPAPPFAHIIPGSGVVEIPEIGRMLRLEFQTPKPLGPLANMAHIAFLDGDDIQFPLLLRSFRPGDRFQPLGMEGEKKVKDLFIDCKIPVVLRKKIPLLFQGDRLLWVAGLRIDHGVRLKPETKRVLYAELL